MTTFESDRLAQGAAIARALDAYASPAGAHLLGRASALAESAPSIVVAAMGSSLSAAMPAVDRVAARRPAVAIEAGELLHYGFDRIAPRTLVVLVSQSGRSAETLAPAQHLRAAGTVSIIAVTNDDASPMSELADLTLPIHAGAEATVATKTFVTTFVTLQALADALGDPDPWIPVAIASNVARVVERIAADDTAARAAAARMADCSSLVVVARGPATSAADYGALIMKETAALPAEAMPAGTFRHGPMEIAGPGVGLVVLAPTGRTQALCVRLAVEASGFGSPTWLIGGDQGELPSTTDGLLVTALPDLPERLAPLSLSVPIQGLAAALAVRYGRKPGVLQRSRKVTDIE